MPVIAIEVKGRSDTVGNGRIKTVPWKTAEKMFPRKVA